MDILNRIKEMIRGQSKTKLIQNTAIVIIIGIIVIIAGGTLFRSREAEAPKTNAKAGNTSDLPDLNDFSTDATESRLKSLLSQIQGVGKVDVMITYSATKESIVAYDTKKNQSTTDEKDSGGGTRSVVEEEYDSTLVYQESHNGGKVPVIIKELEPKVKGVLVVAEGAESVEVKERILFAVTVVLDVPAHKVQVVQRKK